MVDEAPHRGLRKADVMVDDEWMDVEAHDQLVPRPDVPRLDVGDGEQASDAPRKPFSNEMEVVDDGLRAHFWSRRRNASPVHRYGPAHLTNAHRTSARAAACSAARLLMRHGPAVHYSQGATRWQGISEHLVAAKGHYPTALDCSAAVTWYIWNGIAVPYHSGDDVNGLNWGGGFTGTMVRHGLVIPLSRPRLWMRGDAILYGDPDGGTGHTALLVGWDPRYNYHMVISQGSEIGPLYLRWNYRPDACAVRRYI